MGHKNGFKRQKRCIIIHSKYFSVSHWLKSHAQFIITSYCWPYLEQITSKLQQSCRLLQSRGGSYQPRPSSSVDNTLRDLHNSFYHINTNEIPGELSRENLISSHVKIWPLLWLQNKSHLSHQKTIKLKWFGNSLVFI